MKRSILLSIFILVAGFAQAQQSLVFNNTTKFYVDGTSTIHDWTIESNEITGKLAVDASGAVSSVELNLKAESLKSGKSGMDKKVYEAFDTKKNPGILFKSSAVTMNADNKGGVAKGTLSMGGATGQIEVPFTLDSSSGNWVFNGKVDMLMTTFKMAPPTAMLGTIKAGDQVTVRFEVVTSKPEVAKAQ
jgi:polyisoprenoid-binding protein YceI